MIIYQNIFQTIAGSTNEPVKVTVEELKALANDSLLDLNAVYQITDYQINSFAPREDIYNTRGQISIFKLMIRETQHLKIYSVKKFQRIILEMIHGKFIRMKQIK